MTPFQKMLQDRRISIEARGALAVILCRPPDRDFSIAWFCEEIGAGRDKARSIIKELLDIGYGRRERQRTQSGQMSGAAYVFTAEPTPPQAPK